MWIKTTPTPTSPASPYWPPRPARLLFAPSSARRRLLASSAQ